MSRDTRQGGRRGLLPPPLVRLAGVSGEGSGEKWLRTYLLWPGAEPDLPGESDPP